MRSYPLFAESADVQTFADAPVVSPTPAQQEILAALPVFRSSGEDWGCGPYDVWTDDVLEAIVLYDNLVYYVHDGVQGDQLVRRTACLRDTPADYLPRAVLVV